MAATPEAFDALLRFDSLLELLYTEVPALTPLTGGVGFFPLLVGGTRAVFEPSLAFKVPSGFEAV